MMKTLRSLSILSCFIFLFISTLAIYFIFDKSLISEQTSPYILRNTRPKRTYLAIIILSAENNYEKRNAIRNTWLKLRNSADFEYVFVVGKREYNQDERLKKEMLTYEDFLILNVNDSYQSLTKKLIHSFIQLNKLWDFKFILKCDDDSFVRVSDVVNELRSKYDNVNNLYWGFFSGHANVKRNGKWKENEWNLCDKYLPYALGGGYVLSQDIIEFLSINYKRLKLYSSEDASVGLWLAPLNIKKIHDTRFDTEYLSRGCSNSYLITHKHSPDGMKDLYNNIQRTGNLCEMEFKTRLSYVYNWSVPPSKCCYRKNSSIP